MAVSKGKFPSNPRVTVELLIDEDKSGQDARKEPRRKRLGGNGKGIPRAGEAGKWRGYCYFGAIANDGD